MIVSSANIVHIMPYVGVLDFICMEGNQSICIRKLAGLITDLIVVPKVVFMISDLNLLLKFL